MARCHWMDIDGINVSLRYISSSEYIDKYYIKVLRLSFCQSVSRPAKASVLPVSRTGLMAAVHGKRLGEMTIILVCIFAVLNIEDDLQRDEPLCLQQHHDRSMA